VETFLQTGGQKSSWWKPSSSLEDENHRDGNVPPVWRTKIITVETFLHAGGTFPSQFWGKTPALAREKALSTLHLEFILFIDRKVIAAFIKNFQFFNFQFANCQCLLLSALYTLFSSHLRKVFSTLIFIHNF